MAAQRRFALRRLDEPLPGVLAHGFEQPEPGLRRSRVGEHERLLDEPPEHVEDVHLVDRVAGADVFGRLEARPAGEGGQPPEDDPLRLGQQVVAPVDRGAQRLVTSGRGPAAARQEPEPVVEAGRDLLDRERPHPRRGELDRERDAVEAATELGHRPGVLVGHAERGHDRPRPLDEQTAGVHRLEVAGGHALAEVGRRQRGDRQDGLAGHAERLAARDHHADARARPDEGLRQLGALSQDRVAVVEDEQQPLAAQVFDDRRQERPSGGLGQPEGGDHRRQHEVGVGQVAALDDPGAVLELVQQRPRQPKPDPGLAHPTGTGQRQERRPLEDLRGLVDLALAADEARDLEAEVVARRLGGPRRREVARQAGAADLEQPLRQVERAEPVHAEIDEPDLPAQLRADQVVGRLRDEDLPAVTGSADPRGAVDVEPDVALRGAHGLAGVEPHPIAYGDAAGPLPGPDRELALDRRLDRVAGGREDEVQPVARRAALDGAVARERLADQAMVIGQHLGIAVAELLEQPRRALDVGERQGHGARGLGGILGGRGRHASSSAGGDVGTGLRSRHRTGP